MCQNCTDSTYATSINGCTLLGMQMVIPRSQAHWVAMLSYVRAQLGSAASDYATYFRVVPGVYKPTPGLNPTCNGSVTGGMMGVLASSSCTTAGSWRALDGGKWWLRNTVLMDSTAGDYTANAFLAMSSVDLTAAAHGFYDWDAMCHSGGNYVCSTNDFNTGLDTSPLTTSNSSGSAASNYFVQISNPVTTSTVVGMATLPGAMQLPGVPSKLFAGLRTSTRGVALLDGHNGGWDEFAIGALRPFGTLGLPGPSGWAGGVGWVQLFAAMGSLLMCSTGTYAPVGGMTTCLSCPIGTFSSMGASTCSACSPGMYCASPNVPPQLCGLGSMSSAANSTTCLTCAPGTTTLSMGLTTCQVCLVGFFCPQVNCSQTTRTGCGKQSLVFSHSVSGSDQATEYFANAASALSSSGDVTSEVHKFSALGDLAQYRDIDGAFHLRQTWAWNLSGTSCLDILSRNPGASNGTYVITSPSGVKLSVYCDMTTDGGGYTYWPCQNCVSTNFITQPNGCDAVGLKMVIPRSRSHWLSMFAYIQAPVSKGGLGAASIGQYFGVVPGIYKPVGFTATGQCGGGGVGIMNSAYCIDQVNGWRATDGGRWWVRNTPFTQPTGGDYAAFAFLAISLSNGVDGIEMDDWMGPANNGAPYYSGSHYLCSTNDFTGLVSAATIATSGVATVVATANEFVQNHNPTQPSSAVLGYRAVNVQHVGTTSNRFGGLHVSCSSAALVDGDVMNCNNSIGAFAIGEYKPRSGSGLGLSGPSGQFVRWTQLFVLQGGMLLCPAGSYANATGLSVCWACPVGNYCPVAGLSRYVLF